MAESTVVRTKRDITITITDGSASYTVAYEEGDFNLDIPLETVENFLDRGAIPAVPSIRKGNDQPMTFGFSAHERNWWSASDHATLLDLAVVFASSSYVTDNWTSTIGTASDVTTWTVQITQEGSDFGDSDITMTLPYCTIRGGRADGLPNTINISGTSWALRPTVA